MGGKGGDESSGSGSGKKGVGGGKVDDLKDKIQDMKAAVYSAISKVGVDNISRATFCDDTEESC